MTTKDKVLYTLDKEVSKEFNEITEVSEDENSENEENSVETVEQNTYNKPKSVPNFSWERGFENE